MAVVSSRWPRLSRMQRHDLFYGVLFASPWLIGFVLWTVYPIISSLYYSFTRYDLLQPPQFIGLTNYINLTTDDDFFLVIQNTLWRVVLSSPSGMANMAVIEAGLLAARGGGWVDVPADQ